MKISLRSARRARTVQLSICRHWGAAYRRNIGTAAAPNCVYELQPMPTGNSFRALPQEGLTCEVLFTYRDTSQQGIYGVFDVVDGSNPRIDIRFCTQSECVLDMSIAMDEMGPGC